MNDITPKEAIANLNHIYGMVAPDIQRSLDVAIKTLENIDKLNKALDNLSRPFSSILNGIEVNKGDTISREGLKSFAKEKLGDNTLSITMLKVFEEIIDNAPCIYMTIDNAPPVPQVVVFTENTDEKAIEDMKAELQNVLDSERPKGEWIAIAPYTHETFCPYCKEDSKDERYGNFCPNCGADMRKGGAE